MIGGVLRIASRLPVLAKASGLTRHERTIHQAQTAAIADNDISEIERIGGAAQLGAEQAREAIRSRSPAKFLPISNSTHTGIVEGGRERIIQVEDLLRRLGADGLIRLRESDFVQLDALQERFVNFNLERTTNEVGRRYAILAIKRPGHRDKAGREVLPLLDLRRYRIGRCVEVIQHVPIADVPERYYEASLPNLKNALQLKAALVTRYAKMHPQLTREELLSKGCAITTVALE